MNRPLSAKAFMISQLVILLIGLSFIGGLHYLLNVQYQSHSPAFLTNPVTSAPKSLILQVSDPDDDSLVFKSRLLLSGKTLPNLAILISTGETSQVITSLADGRFSSSINLKEGPNKISLTVFSPVGEEKTVVKNVYYSLEQI